MKPSKFCLSASTVLPCLLALGLGQPVGAMTDTTAPSALAAKRAAALEPIIQQRQRYPALFKQAYARYPNLPAGSLEAIAWVQSAWRNLQPEAAILESDHHMPPAWGVMGLYHGHGFSDQVAIAAQLTGLSEKAILTDPAANVMAAAALLDQALQDTRSQTTGMQSAEKSLARALAAYAGFGDGTGEIMAYARDSFAYQVLDSLHRGISRNGVQVPRLSMDLDEAFAPDRLHLLQASRLSMDPREDTVRLSVPDNLTPPGPADNSDATHATTNVDYPYAIWNPASPANYSTAWNPDTAVIIHDMEGSYAGAIAWFQNPNAQVSAHYLLRRSDGQITQMVQEEFRAWHAAYHNDYTIGLEHEGYADAPANWTQAMMQASASLTRNICQRRGIDCSTAWPGPGHDHWHLVADSYRIKGHGMLSYNQNRYDPGPYFPWAQYYSMINNGAPPPPVAPTYWVDTFANAPGYDSPGSGNQTGTLYQGTNYVYCKMWGPQVGSGNAYNHWWLKTDLDVGPGGQWVSAYYLSRWGNDEARTNDGYRLPRCDVLPYGRIGAKYYAMDGIRGELGLPELEEMDANGGGRFQQFENGIILWHDGVGAFWVRGKILDHFWATGNEAVWGYPTMDEMDTGSPSPVTGQQGRYQYFQNGLFLWTPATGAHVVHGAILDYFESHGRETSFGFPASDEMDWGSNGRKQTFEQATLYWSPDEGVSEG